MQLISKAQLLQEQIQKWTRSGTSWGFVPTMGALHQGHLSLVEQSQKQDDLTVISIFVNPNQFNNKKDLAAYPRTLEKDLKLLEGFEDLVVFAPEVSEVYPVDYKGTNIELGKLDEVMEGKHRPGHFQGVVTVVERLFRLVQPKRAYFGRKDFQQVAVIKHMTKTLDFNIEIVECDTIREESGLAMSSRNMLLSEEGKILAQKLYQKLDKARTLSLSHLPKEIRVLIESEFSGEDVVLEYFSIVHPNTLEELTDYWVPGATACIVAHVEGVRLIDNMELVARQEVVSSN